MKKSRSINLSDLSPSFLKRNPHLMEELKGTSGASRMPATPSGASKQAEIAEKRKQARKMTRAEIEYQAILKARFPECEVLYERYTLKLADDLRYVPDFAVVHSSGVIDFWEIKGKHIFSRALHKPKIAAEQYRHRFSVAHKIGESWEVTILNGKIDQ